MSQVSGTITGFGSRPFTAKTGKSYTSHIIELSDGQSYDVGLKQLTGFKVGDEINFHAEVKFGKQAVDPTTVRRGALAAGTVIPPNPTAARSTGGSSGGSRAGQFPIARDDGQRSIIRQNALTQANTLFATIANANKTKVDGTPQEVALKLIDVAKVFEAYATGEIEAVAAKAQAAKAAAAKAAEAAAKAAAEAVAASDAAGDANEEEAGY